MFRFLFRRRRGLPTPHDRDLDNVSVFVGVNGVESTIVEDGYEDAPQICENATTIPKERTSSSDAADASSNLRVLGQQAGSEAKAKEDTIENIMQLLSCIDIAATFTAAEKFLSNHKRQEVSSLSISEDEDDRDSELTVEDASESDCSDEHSKYSLSSKCSDESSTDSDESSKCSGKEGSSDKSNESESSWGETAVQSETTLAHAVDEGSLLLSSATSRTSDPFGGFSWDTQDVTIPLQKKFKLQDLPTASTAESSAHISFAEESI